jgi:acyltransferase
MPQNDLKIIERIEWVDSLKTFAIYTVFLGHVTIDAKLEVYIFSFHVPLFFWISGFLFQRERYLCAVNFISRRIRTLVVPYFFFAFISFFFWLVVVRSLSIRGQALSLDPWKVFLGIFYAIGTGPWHHPLDLALWFLPCLFVTELFYWFLRTKLKDTGLVLFLVVGACAGYLLSIHTTIRLPWSVDVALTAVAFYAIGDISKKAIRFIVELDFKPRLVVAVFSFLVSYFFSCVNGKVDMNLVEYGNPALFYLSAMCGILFWVTIISSLPSTKIVTYLGGNTIIVLGLAGTSGFVLHGLYFLLTGKLLGADKLIFPEAIIFSFLQIIIIVPAIYFVNRFLPFILGRQSLAR